MRVRRNFGVVGDNRKFGNFAKKIRRIWIFSIGLESSFDYKKKTGTILIL